MPSPFQYMNSLNVEFANFTTPSDAALDLGYSAGNGEIASCTPTGTGCVLNLPPVAEGGPVTVLNLATTATYVVTVKTTDSSEINGVAGATGYTVAIASASGVPSYAVFVSDGSNWWTIARANA